jgi:hypothetical protein
MHRHHAPRCSLLLALIAAPHAAADTSSQPMIAYGERAVPAPAHRTWDGNVWSPEQPAAVLADDAKWIVLENCPVRDEMALAGLGASASLHLAIHDGVSWSASTEVCADTHVHNQRPFSLAYEQQSGELLVAYYTRALVAVGYRTFDGFTLSPQRQLNLPMPRKLRWIGLYPRRGTDTIMMLALNDDRHVIASVWDGNAWGPFTTLETEVPYDVYEAGDFAWEQSSGRGLAVYGHSGAPEPRYRTWTDAGGWSAEALLPSVGKEARWVRLAAAPVGDAVLFGCLTDDRDISVNIWNGALWGAGLEVETSAQAHDRRTFDIAWERGGGRAMIGYAERNRTTLRYRTWDGSTWSGERIGPDVGERFRVVSLTTGLTSGEVFVLANDNGRDLNFMRWDGAALSANTVLENDLGTAGRTQMFMIAGPPPEGWRVTRWQEVPR